jgi:hypothetical protein
MITILIANVKQCVAIQHIQRKSAFVAASSPTGLIPTIGRQIPHVDIDGMVSWRHRLDEA